jgi:hypothetical protein
MNSLSPSEELKYGRKESESSTKSTLEYQEKSSINQPNEIYIKIKNFVETDFTEKNAFKESKEKITLINNRLENSKISINLIKEKIAKMRLKRETND